MVALGYGSENFREFFPVRGRTISREIIRGSRAHYSLLFNVDEKAERMV
jgi:hypothetical protein